MIKSKVVKRLLNASNALLDKSYTMKGCKYFYTGIVPDRTEFRNAFYSFEQSLKTGLLTVNDELEKYEHDDEHGLTPLEIKEMIKENKRLKINALLHELDELVNWNDEFKKGVLISSNSMGRLMITVNKVATLYTDYTDYCRANMEM